MTFLAFCCHRQHWRWANALDNLVLDTSFRLRPPHTPAEVATSLPSTRDIVMIELPHPIPRHVLARLPLLLRQAKAVALDLMLVDQDLELNDNERAWYSAEQRGWRRDTEALAAACKQSGNVVIGAWADEAWRESPRAPHSFMRSRIWTLPNAQLWQSARYHAHLLVQPDPQDHIVRQVPLFQTLPTAPGMATTTRRTPCLGLALAAAARNISPAALDVLLRDLSPRGGVLRLGDLAIPYDEDGLLTINYVGDRQCFEYGTNRVVYDRVLRLYQPSDFAGKLVVIGSSDFTSKDCYPTPYGMMTGMQIHANVVSTLLAAPRNDAKPSLSLIVWLAFLCSLLPILPLLRWPLWSSFLVALTESLAVIFIAAYWIAASRTMFAASIPIFAIILTYNAVALYEFSRIRFTLSQFIGVRMMQRTLQRLTRLRLGGGRVEEASALFCDLRGYTAFSAALPPETVTELLNAYTEMVVTIVERFQGRPIDFTGDGVFVLFEQSLAGRHFPRQAVRAALEIHAAFTRMQSGWQAQGLPAIGIGVAVHTGRMMIGVLGAEHFLKMGAVGDVVNIAARVQGLSRQCGHDVLITRETYGYVSSDIPATYCGAFTIAGYRQPIAIYGLGDAPDDCTPRGTPRCATPETHMSQHPATPHQISHRQELFP